MNIALSIHTLPEISPAFMAALEPSILVALQQEVEEHYRRAQEIKASLEEAIVRRYSDRVALLRHQNHKPTGILRFNDGPFVVVADQPKKPEWDQEQLAFITEQLRSAGMDPQEYVEVTYRVSERRYEAWPTSVRQIFEPARTLKVGRQTFKIEQPKSQGER
ncbi:MAG: hypothetical protein HQM06_17860 [Magnetococcales bacterium]|nr:hypothetical protein [Magnetococcales bacterium]